MIKHILYTIASCIMIAFMTSCSQELEESNVKQGVMTSFTVSSEIVPMHIEGAPDSRINIKGDKFQENDFIRLKMVTPYDIEAAGRGHDSEFGESTWGGSIDNYFLLRWDGKAQGEGYTGWTTSGFNAFGLDINGDGKYGDGAPGLQFLSQQTPYVFTANTWNRSIGFKTTGTWRVIFKSTFYADQSIENNFRASDLLWAQTITQTCTDQVTLSFHHVLSELLITIPDGMTKATVTLEGMPDVDQQEFVVGDYYANAYYNFSDLLSFSRISYVDDKNKNGKVIGLSYIENNAYKLKELSTLEYNATYTAYHAGGQVYRIIVPPTEVNTASKIVLRNIDSTGAAKKYEYTLKKNVGTTVFEANKCYPIELTITQ